MKLLRLSAILAMCFAFIVLATSASAEDTAVDKDRIVGTWKLVKSGGKAPTEKNVIQFTKDGKVKVTRFFTVIIEEGKDKGKKDTKTETLEGTYKIEGNKLTLVHKSRTAADKLYGPEAKITATIKTLTDKELVMVDDKGREEELEKTK